MPDTRVTFVELPTFEGVVPLASGYMEAMCRTDHDLAGRCRFEKISLPVKTPWREVLGALRQCDADVYAFSCYVWNSGMVRRLLAGLLEAQPGAKFILGGPQVMHQAKKYLSPDHENVFVCNGEGERTFPNFLRTHLSSERDFTAVRGLSFYREGQLVTTAPEPRIADLSEIPSPFLEGLFERRKYTWMLIETNRGCPFKCNYCYWGGAVGAKVYKYDNDRITRELEWISRSQAWYLYIADANWGMLPRDVELSRFIAEGCRRHGAPMSVHFCASKNTPARVAEISRIFHDAGILSSCSVALQTMNPVVLERVERDNIKTSAYIELQKSLNDHGMSSYVEMIWPLPGETLASFEEGLAKLCALGADCFSVYNLLLMNNVAMADRKDEFGLVSVRDPNPNSEAEIVVQTGDVSREAYGAGMRYYYCVTSLHTLRGLACLSSYLHASGTLEYLGLFRAFAEFCRRRPSHPWVGFCEQTIRSFDAETFGNMGPVVHAVLHSLREEFDELLEAFVTSQPFWQDGAARFLFEVDLLNRPYIYRNTPMVAKRHAFTELSLAAIDDRSYVIDVEPARVGLLRRHVGLQEEPSAGHTFRVDHGRNQLPFSDRKSLEEHYVYCFAMSQHMKDVAPIWRRDLVEAGEPVGA